MGEFKIAKILGILTVALLLSILWQPTSCFIESGCRGYWLVHWTSVRSDDSTSDKAGFEKFQSYSTEAQLDIYLYARCYTFTGAGSIEKYLRTDFENKLPYIARKIRTSENARDKVELFDLFNYEDIDLLKKHPEIVQVIYDAQPQISESDDANTKSWKELYIERVLQLKGILNR
jgi:hypothetical protein